MRLTTPNGMQTQACFATAQFPHAAAARIVTDSFISPQHDQKYVFYEEIFDNTNGMKSNNSTTHVHEPSNLKKMQFSVKI